jgi:hypothetical protein
MPAVLLGGRGRTRRVDARPAGYTTPGHIVIAALSPSPPPAPRGGRR